MEFTASVSAPVELGRLEQPFKAGPKDCYRIVWHRLRVVYVTADVG